MLNIYNASKLKVTCKELARCPFSYYLCDNLKQCNLFFSTYVSCIRISGSLWVRRFYGAQRTTEL